MDGDCSAFLPFNPKTVQHTPGHLNCPACAEAQNRLIVPLSPSMSFIEAAACFMGSRAPIGDGRVRRRAPRTYKGYSRDLHMLGQFFGELRLDQIHAGHLVTYQNSRAAGDGFVHRVGGKRKGWKEVPTSAGAAIINRELGLLKCIMELAEAWSPALKVRYERLQQPDSDIPRALSPDEQDRFLEVAASNPDWHVIWWYAQVALTTTFSSDEMRTMRQGDINLARGIVSVNRNFGKNKHRRRSVTINDGACLWALERLIERSVELGGKGPERFVFPFREARGHYDGERPVSPTGLRKPFENVRKVAGVAWFGINGFRHSGATRMAEAGVPWPIIRQRMGHVGSPKITWHYIQISEQAERAAMQAMQEKKPVVSIRQAQLRRQLA